MIFKTLGFMDLIAVILLLGAAIFPSKLLLYAAVYLVVKGFFFIFVSKDIASFGDALSGVYILMFIIGLSSSVLNTIVLLYLGQKTFFTFVKISVETFVFVRELRQARPASGSSTAFYYLR